MPRPGETGEDAPRTLDELDSTFRSLVGADLASIPKMTDNLESAGEEALSRIEEDWRDLAQLLDQSSSRIELDDFERSAHVVRWGFPFRGESIEQDSEWLQYNLAHLRMAGDVLRHEIIPLIQRLLPSIQRDLERSDFPLSLEEVDELGRTFKELHTLWSASANLLDVAEQYEKAYGFSRDLIDPDFEYEPPWKSTAHIYEDEFNDAARTLLLSNESGRHAPAPLIRTEIEVLASRLIRRPMEGSDYEGKQVIATKGLSADAIADAAKDLDVPIIFEADTLKRMYEWGSISAHFGYRYPHEELWYGLMFAQALRRNRFVQAPEEEAVELYDKLIAELERKDKLQIEDPG